MNQAQLEARKRKILKVLEQDEIPPTYEIRMKRLKDPRLYGDFRKRIK